MHQSLTLQVKISIGFYIPYQNFDRNALPIALFYANPVFFVEAQVIAWIKITMNPWFFCGRVSQNRKMACQTRTTHFALRPQSSGGITPGFIPKDVSIYLWNYHPAMPVGKFGS